MSRSLKQSSWCVLAHAWPLKLAFLLPSGEQQTLHQAGDSVRQRYMKCPWKTQQSSLKHLSQNVGESDSNLWCGSGACCLGAITRHEWIRFSVRRSESVPLLWFGSRWYRLVPWKPTLICLCRASGLELGLKCEHHRARGFVLLKTLLYVTMFVTKRWSFL